MRSKCGWRTAAAALVCATLAAAQESASIFKAAMLFGDGETSVRTLLDYDGDGAQDGLSAMVTAAGNPAPVTLKGFRNVGGALVEDWSYVYGLTTFALGDPDLYTVSADFDQDGLMDFVVVGGAEARAFRSNGAGQAPTPLWAWSHTVSATLRGVATSDFDLDGDDDVALAVVPVSFAAPPFVATLLTSGSSTPAIGGTTPIQWATDHRLATIDLDGAAPRDLIAFVTPQNVGGASSFAVTFTMSPLATPTPVPAGYYPWFPGRLRGVVIDVDQDGDEDVLASLFAESLVGPIPTGPRRRILRNTGGTLTSEPDQPGFMIETLGDFDGDGDLDGFSGPLGPMLSPAQSARVGGVAVTLLDAGFVETGAFEILTVGAGVVGVADLDADGDLDFVAERSVYYAGGGTTPPHRHGFALSDRFPPLDHDGDGDPDFDAGFPNVATNDGRGFFATAPLVASPPAGTVPRGYGLRLDIDGDGDLDLVATTAPAQNVPNLTRRWANRGDGYCVDAGLAATSSMGEFAPNVAFIDGLNPEDAWTGDFDGDGDVDVAVAADDLGVLRTRVWLNDGTGFFTPQPQMLGFMAGGAADFDGDGLCDLVGYVGAAWAALPEVRRAAGGGAFLAPGAPGGFGPLAVGAGPVGVLALADFDQDGHLDVATFESAVGATPARVRFHAFAAGSFVAGPATPAAVPGITFAGRFTTADLDVDGDADLVDLVAGFAGQLGAFFLNLGGGVFAAPTVEALDPLGLADVDGDGDVDAIGFDRVALNRLRSPSTGGVRLQYGAGSAGTGGAVPVLGAAGLRGAGEIHEFRLRGCLGGAAGLFGAGALQLNQPLFGSTLLAFPEILLPFTTTGAPGVAGAGGYDLPFLVPPQIAGFPFFHQVAIADPAAPSGLAFSNGLMVVYGS